MLLERARYPAPRLVAFDDGPRETDVRALLMTRLPGRVELAPQNARTVAAHRWPQALPLIPRAAVCQHYAATVRTTSPRARDIPRWSKQPKAWRRRARSRVGRRQPRTTPRFIHRDYHPGNILWTRGRLSGVVDWINACAGPPQVDVAHCRVNLVRLHGVEVADAFLAAYASASGTSVGGLRSVLGRDGASWTPAFAAR